MSNTKKRSGLGAESYFENIPALASTADEETDGTKANALELQPETQDNSPEPVERLKIRRTYALYEETQIALEEMKLAARKAGKKVTLGDLLEEAVQLLMEKKGVASQETTSQ